MLEKWQMNLLLQIDRNCGFTIDLEEIKNIINELCQPLNFSTPAYIEKINIDDNRNDEDAYVKEIRVKNKKYRIIVNDTEIKVDCISNFPNGYIPQLKVELNKKERTLKKYGFGTNEEIPVEGLNYREIINDMMNSLTAEIVRIEAEKKLSSR